MKRIVCGLVVGLVAACSTAASERKAPALDLDAVGSIVQRAPALEAAARNVFARSGFEGDDAHLRRRNAVSPLDELIVDAPASSDGAFRAAVGGVRRIGVDMTLLDGAARDAQLRSGRVVYREVFAATDLVATADATRLEHFLVLRDERAPHQFRWRLEGGKGVTAKADGDHVEFVDAREESQVTLMPIVAVDQTGARVAARSVFVNGVLTIDVPGGLHYPVIVDPALETARWVIRTDVQPTSGERYALTQVGWNPNTNLVLANGEATYYTTGLTETWNPAGAPPTANQWQVVAQTKTGIMDPTFGEFRAGIVYHPGRKKVVALSYIGRNNFTGAHNALYEWDDAQLNWSPITTAHFPSGARSGVAIAYDASRGVLSTFGGAIDSSTGGFSLATNETWEYDGTDFKQIVGAGGDNDGTPGIAYDSGRQKLVLGTLGGTKLDTWEFENGKWAPKAAAHAPPAPIAGLQQDGSVNMVFDPVSGKTILQLDVNTYEWDGVDWTQKSTAGRKGALVYDPVRRRVLSVTQGASDGETYISPWSIWEYHRRGAACATSATCDTGACVDGVCCESASCGACNACNLGGTEGTCAPVVQDEHDTCTGTHECFAGTCLLKTGSACTTSAQCGPGHCVDGLCCNTACNTVCQACAAALKDSGTDDGTCGPAKAGLNPHGDECGKQAGSCGHDGLCDGKGACRNYINGSACGTTSVCVNSGEAKGDLCNGGGTCSSSAVLCSPGVCTGKSCTLSCATDADCDPEQGFCDGTICKDRFPSGSNACTRDAECASRSCVDGFCCNSLCAGECEACDVKGSLGACVPTKGAPHGARAACPTLAQTNDACAVGTCNGDTRTSCAGFPGPEVACRPAACANGVATIAAGCSSKGACAVVQTKECSPYACAGETCAMTCASDRDCAANATCALDTKTCVTGKTCDGDHTLKSADGDQDCAPYKCEGSGCKKTCATVDDCVAPTVCNSSGNCVASTASTDNSSSGCGMSPAPPRSRSSAGALFGLALALTAARRRFNSRAAA